MSANIISKGRSTIQFSASSDRPITEQEAMEAQNRLGYHPMGYGFYGFDGECVDNRYTVTWCCHASCD